MTKRFKANPMADGRGNIWYGLFDNNESEYICDAWNGAERCCRLLNELYEENQKLQKENREYNKIFNCRNCKHLDYDWYEDGDEFEVCDKGNTERMVYNRFCKEWKRS